MFNREGWCGGFAIEVWGMGSVSSLILHESFLTFKCG